MRPFIVLPRKTPMRDLPPMTLASDHRGSLLLRTWDGIVILKGLGSAMEQGAFYNSESQLDVAVEKIHGVLGFED